MIDEPIPDPDAHQLPIHHHRPMQHQRSNFQWEGKPGEGFDLNTFHYICAEPDCDATCIVSYRIPS